MPVFEPGSSSVESNRSANWAKNPLQRHKQILLIWWQIKRDDWSILIKRSKEFVWRPQRGETMMTLRFDLAVFEEKGVWEILFVPIVVAGL